MVWCVGDTMRWDATRVGCGVSCAQWVSSVCFVGVVLVGGLFGLGVACGGDVFGVFGCDMGCCLVGWRCDPRVDMLLFVFAACVCVCWCVRVC